MLNATINTRLAALLTSGKALHQSTPAPGQVQPAAAAPMQPHCRGPAVRRMTWAQATQLVLLHCLAYCCNPCDCVALPHVTGCSTPIHIYSELLSPKDMTSSQTGWRRCFKRAQTGAQKQLLAQLITGNVAGWLYTTAAAPKAKYAQSNQFLAC